MKFLLIITTLGKLYCGFADSFGFGNEYWSYAIDFCWQLTLAVAFLQAVRQTRLRYIAAGIAALCVLQILVHVMVTNNPDSGSTRPAVWACLFAIGLIVWVIQKEIKSRKAQP